MRNILYNKLNTLKVVGPSNEIPATIFTFCLYLVVFGIDSAGEVGSLQ